MAGGVVTKRMRRQKCDIISSLPDAVLCHILSFVPTKYSVRTRLLSTRWKYLFAFVPILDFSYYNYIDDDCRRRFIDFVNKMLMMYNIPQMSRFRLVSPHISPEHLGNVVSWIRSAICRNVQELDISLDNGGTKKRLPLDLFLCEKLSLLKLDGPFEIELPNHAFLPCLKILHLQNISFISFDGSIVSFCPALTDFSAAYCDFGKVLDISHPILRKLQIENCYEHELVLNAPSLVCFEYWNSTNTVVRGPNVMTSLVKAEISPKRADLCFNDSIDKLVTLASHARHLYLSTSVLWAFEDSTKALPTFHNLTRLEVGTVISCLLKVLPDILNKCSLLEVLVFYLEGCSFEEPNDIEECSIDMKCYENVPSCVSVHLKEIEFGVIYNMWGPEWKLVEYFLRNANVLKKMKIRPSMSLEKQFFKEFTKKLLAFPRFSKECQIVIE